MQGKQMAINLRDAFTEQQIECKLFGRLAKHKIEQQSSWSNKTTIESILIVYLFYIYEFEPNQFHLYTNFSNKNIIITKYILSFYKTTHQFYFCPK